MRTLFIFALTILLTACFNTTSVRYGSEPTYTRNAPPPHAPAHGYRHKHNNQNLIYDSGVGVYVVVGLTDYFFSDGLYFRYHSGNWEVSANLDNGWSLAEQRVVPQKLWQSKSKNHGHKGNNQKGEHPGKGNKPEK